jgi:hypothetical protein
MPTDECRPATAEEFNSGFWQLITSTKNVLLIRHTVVLLWTSDQPVAKASAYTEQHNTETRRQTPIPRAGFEPTIPVTRRPRPTPHTVRVPGPACSLFRDAFSVKQTI